LASNATETADIEPEEPAHCSFADYVRLEQEATSSDASREFWRDQLLAAAGEDIPGLPATPVRTQAIESSNVLISDDVAYGIQRASESFGIPLKHLFVAAHLRVLSTVAGRRRVRTGLVTSGRPEMSGGDRLLGLFLNTVPFCPVSAGVSWIEVARSAFE